MRPLLYCDHCGCEMPVGWCAPCSELWTRASVIAGELHIAQRRVADIRRAAAMVDVELAARRARREVA